jgi:hypothetical protein
MEFVFPFNAFSLANAEACCYSSSLFGGRQTNHRDEEYQNAGEGNDNPRQAAQGMFRLNIIASRTESFLLTFLIYTTPTRRT